MAISTARFTGLILGATVHLIRRFPCILMCKRIEFQGVPPCLIPRNIRVYTDVAEVSQECLSNAGILRDRPKNSLSATESVTPRRHPEGLLCAFLKLPISPSQVPGVVASISGVCTLRSTVDRTVL